MISAAIYKSKQHNKKRLQKRNADSDEELLEKIVLGVDVVGRFKDAKRSKSHEDDPISIDGQSSSNDEDSEEENDEHEDQDEDIVIKLGSNANSDPENVEETDQEPSTNENKAAWQDNDDIIDCNEGFSSANQLPRKVTVEKQYKEYLENKFKELHGTPAWASKDFKKKRDSESEDEDEDNLLQTAGNFIKKSKILKKGHIKVKKCPFLNTEDRANGIIKSVQFNPTANAALVSSKNVIDLFEVDGKDNTKLQSIHFEKFEIDRARFTIDGEQLIVGSKRTHGRFFSYDLLAGQSSEILFAKGKESYSLQRFTLSNDGKYIACRGKYGFIHLLKTDTKEYIYDFKANGDIYALQFSDDSSKLFTHGNDGKVYIWDMKTRRCLHRFVDEGSIAGTALSISPNQRFLATGSDSGVVNIYDFNDACNQAEPKPLKTLMNLITEIDCLKFNHTSELLAMSSSHKNDSLRIVHMPSLSVYSNFPWMGANFRKIQEIDFSQNSGYLTFGNNSGFAHLFRLQHFINY